MIRQQGPGFCSVTGDSPFFGPVVLAGAGRPSMGGPSRVPLCQDVSIGTGGINIHIKWGKACQDPTQGFWVPLRAV